MKRLSPCFALFSMLLLAACTAVPVSTMWKLRKFDLATTNIKKLQAAVRTPDFVHISDGKTKLKITLTSKAGKLHAREEFKLVRVPGSQAGAELKRFTKPGFRLSAFRISPKDYERVEMFTAQFALLKTRYGKNLHGSLSVTTSGCEVAGHADQPLAVTTYLKSVETGEFIPLTNEIDLRKYALNKKVNRCTSSQN